MKIDSTQWQDTVRAGAAQLRLDVTAEQIDQLAQHARLVLEWNRKVNLTTITDPIQMAAKHFLDSIAPFKHIPQTGRLLDMGTGGGFPGIPLKILRPQQPMTLIDGTRKKIHFVKHVIRELGLRDIAAKHERAEGLWGREAHAGRYAVIVSRAVADLKEAVRLAQPLLVPGGTIVLYKGPKEIIPDTLSLSTLAPNGQRDVIFQITSIVYRLPIVQDSRRAVILRAQTE